VDPRSEIREFLTSRRAKITPQQAGLPVFGDTRRVPGLRREEAAMLAGVSVDYYTKMERGNLRGVSEGVLEALARGLQLDEAERAHLFDLARAAGPLSRPRRRSAAQRVRPSVQRIIDAMTDAPALVQNGRGDVLAANRLGLALYSEMDLAPPRPANHARFVFLDPRARRFFLDWERVADDTVAMLRAEAGRDPHDRNGRRTTSAPTRPAPSATTTRSSGTSPSPTRSSSSQPTLASTSSPSAPSPAPHHTTRSASSEAGPPQPGRQRPTRRKPDADRRDDPDR
jgi:transcriptional regulator with XRE-family HTH domain